MEQQGFFQSPELRELMVGMVREVVAEFVAENELKAREISLVERLINVEEEIKAIHKVQVVQFEAMEKRFEAIEKANQQRFDALQLQN